MDTKMTRWMKLSQLLAVVLVVSGVTLILPGQAQAEWDFSEVCSPATQSEVVIAKGAAMLMLDRSGSMELNHSELCNVEVCCYSNFSNDPAYGFASDVGNCGGAETCTATSTESIGHSTDGESIRCNRCNFDDIFTAHEDCCLQRITNLSDAGNSLEGYHCGDILWDVAVNSLTDVTAALRDDLYFGLGFFTTGDGGTVIEVEANEDDQINKIATALAAQSPGGGTPTHEAINAIATSETLAMDRSAGILITDGVPLNNEQNTIDATCDARDINGITNYIVGLGGGTYTEFNNLQAAAAGTGCCGAGAEEGCPNGIGVDPCDAASINDVDWSTCHGSYSAANYDQFTEVLKGISAEISCTFPINVEDWDEGLPDDPTVVQVTVDGMYGADEPISHVSMSADGEGWEFTSNSRDSVTFTPGVCARVLDPNDISHVTTRPACHCETELTRLEVESPADYYCQVPNVINSACPAKPKVCDGGIMVCSSGPATDLQENCPWVNCPELLTPEICHVDNTPVINAHPTKPTWGEPEGSGDIDEERNRCKLGVLNCEISTGAWCEPLSPMPELCDGLDNNCDGLIDNMSTGWEQVTDTTYPYDDSHIPLMSIPPDAEYPGAACYEEDFCGCSDGNRGEHGGLQAVLDGADVDAEFAEYLDDWVPESEGGCSCAPSLSR